MATSVSLFLRFHHQLLLLLHSHKVLDTTTRRRLSATFGVLLVPVHLIATPLSVHSEVTDLGNLLSNLEKGVCEDISYTRRAGLPLEKEVTPQVEGSPKPTN